MHIRPLDAADLRAHMPAFVTLLVENVAAGASIGFLAPLDALEAERFWDGVAAGLARGERVLLAAFDERRALLGAGQLGLETKLNGRHRAEVQKLMVAPATRRRGVARALMDALDAAARARGRTLLMLDTREGDAAAALYHSLGWTLLGRVPGFVGESDGGFSATLFFYRTL